LHHSRRPKQTFVRYASLVYEPGATKLSFFLEKWPKKGVLSLNVKGDQQTHKKMMPPVMSSISRKSSYNVPIMIFRCYIMGDEPITIEQSFLWVRGGYYGFDYGKSKYYGFGLWE
jgi:hypothetical protein